LIAGAGSAKEQNSAGQFEYKLNFDDLAPGTLPKGWTVDATDPGGKLAGWKVAADPNALSKPNVLALTTVHDTSGSVFREPLKMRLLAQYGVAVSSAMLINVLC
jgi:hypothetical protein